MSTNEDENLALATSLTPREEAALRVWSGLGQPPLSPSLSAKLYELFLRGRSCLEIVDLNPGISLGAVVSARVRDNWDVRRQEYRLRLEEEVYDRVRTSTLETLDRLSLELHASNKLAMAKLQRYLQTGDENEIKDMNLDSSKHMAGIVSLLRELTGAGDKKKHEVSVTLTSSKPATEAKVVEGVTDYEQILKRIRDGRE